MKKLIFLLIIGFSVTRIWSQEKRDFRIPLIGETAPSFTAESTKGTINFPSDYGKKWKILISHPQDFTPVCSSELLELSNLQNDFKKLNAQIVVVSTDNLVAHQDWVNALNEVKYKGREPVKIDFPLVDDSGKNVAKLYGMIHPESNTSKDVRGVFIIDPDNVVQAISFYPMSVGRNINEIERTLEALEEGKATSLLTPANWQKGDDLLIPYQKSVSQPEKEDGLYKVAWFMTFKKEK